MVTLVSLRAGLIKYMNKWEGPACGWQDPIPGVIGHGKEKILGPTASGCLLDLLSQEIEERGNVGAHFPTARLPLCSSMTPRLRNLTIV